MATISEEAVALSLDDRLFELIINPTEKCNFRCSYCYEDFQIGRMQRPIINALKALISARAPKLGRLSMSWFGGEPMLGDKVIFEVAEHVARLSCEHGFSYSGGLTTNGYLLTASKVGRLAELHHNSYQITLDGVGADHDKTRKLANGKGTFHQIWRNLLMMRDMNFDLRVMLRIHITPSNKDSILRLLDIINRDLGQSDKFYIHFHRVSDLGGPGGSTVTEMPWEEYGKLLKELRYIAGIPSNSEHGLAAAGHICYAAKPNSLMVRADGRIGKCTVALDDPRNDVGRLRPDGTIEFYNERLRLWFERFRELDAGVLGCPLATLGNIKKASETTQPTGIELALI